MNQLENILTNLERSYKKLDRLNALRAAAADPAGKTLLAELRTITGADKRCFRPDPHGTAYIVGLRDAYVLLMEKLDDGELEKLETQIAELLKKQQVINEQQGEG